MPSAWENEWNNIIRYVLFSDSTLKTLMCIPENTKILDFVDKYFINAGYTSEILIDEPVRIIYGVIPYGTGAMPHVLNQEMSFDIYVKNEYLRNYGKDRLVMRNHLIAERLSKLLTNQYDQRLGGYKFICIGESDMGSSAIGYSRYNITFNFKRTI